MDIIQAIHDQNLIRPFFGKSLDTWTPWFVALRVLFGLPIKSRRSRKLIHLCTGRDPNKLPKSGFQTALFLTGRRSGKSRISSVIGAHASVLAGLESRLSVGEAGVCAVICPTKNQGKIVHGYLRGIFQAPMLKKEIVSSRWDHFDLRNGVRLEIFPGNYKTVRGFSLLCAVVDEICFFGQELESRCRSDTELIRALQPALSTTKGRLICIGSPYSRKGWAWQTYSKHWAKDDSDVLVWNCPSRTMNPKLSQKYIDRALAEDLASARCEYYGEFRDDITQFLPLELIENLVVRGRIENLPSNYLKYQAFVDLSGGRNDASCLCIAHKEGRTIILDYCKLWRAPNNPHAVVGEIAAILHQWKVTRVTGDNFAAEFAAAAFAAAGIKYRKSEKAKSQLYAELLPIMCAAEIELLDDSTLVKQLAGLERRTRSGGKDIIDHSHSGHDDAANALAGVAVQCSHKLLVAGAAGF